MAAQIGFDDVSLNQKYDMADEAGSSSEACNNGLECNICLDSAHEPVVTLCGHLYCWPCIYQWLDVQGSHDESHQEPKCPICKASISANALVPLYGRDDAGSRISEHGIRVPNRPTFNLRNLQQSRSSSHSTHGWERSGHHFASSSPPQLDQETLSVLLNPMVCKFGEMVYARIFGSSGSDASIYPHISSANPRIRRREKEVEKSLNRLSFFLLCCVLLCLFFF
uniref:E3 ubiquitin-protein ligase RMA n=1 Tax=Kalanchoe fedtschenkoi TaxID=63787 RepID=A0A7N0REF5_KALFE